MITDALCMLSVSLQVLSTAENITKRLATEKACSWLSANVTGLQLTHCVSMLNAFYCVFAPINTSFILTVSPYKTGVEEQVRPRDEDLRKPAASGRT